MKKLFERMKSYSFWVSLSGALIIFINCLGRIFNFQIENEIVEDVIMSIAGLLVVLGFVTKEASVDKTDDNLEDIEEENSEEGVASEDNNEQMDKDADEKAIENQDKHNPSNDDRELK